MTKSKIRQLEQRLARYEAQLDPELVAIAESDTAVMTTRMSGRERMIAQRYRAVVQQLAGC